MPRTALVIEITPAMQAVMDDAAIAYGMDASYAVAMCARARVCIAKQATWRSRTSLRAAEAEARTLCEDGPDFTCTNPLPCSVGPGCRYSTGALREFEPTLIPLGPCRGGRDVQRPQPGPDGTHGSYNLESVVHAWRDHLEASSGAT